MGEVESKAKKRKTRDNVQRAVLGSLAVAGGLAVLSIAPNAAQLLKFGTNDRRFAYRAQTALSRLGTKGLVSFETRDGKRFARLTRAGQQALELEKVKIALSTKKRRRWDGQWRMVIFDIPEKRRSIRIRLVRLMREMGFLKIQDSVWVFPYDCEELMTLIKTELKTGNSTLYAVVSSIENDKRIKQHFGLSKE